MIGIGRKKLCEYTFTFDEELISKKNIVTNKMDFSFEEKIIIEAKIFNENCLEFTEDLIPILNFLVNYTRSIRTLREEVANKLIFYSFQFSKATMDSKLIVSGVSLIDSIKTTLFYSERKKINKIFLLQNYSGRTNYEKYNARKIYLQKYFPNLNIDIVYEEEIITFLVLWFREIVKKIEGENLKKLESSIKFINDFFSYMYKKNIKANMLKEHNYEIKKIMRHLEVNIFNIWRELESPNYSIDDFKQIVKKLNI